MSPITNFKDFVVHQFRFGLFFFYRLISFLEVFREYRLIGSFFFASQPALLAQWDSLLSVGLFRHVIMYSQGAFAVGEAWFTRQCWFSLIPYHFPFSAYWYFGVKRSFYSLPCKGTTVHGARFSPALLLSAFWRKSKPSVLFRWIMSRSSPWSHWRQNTAYWRPANSR